VTDNGVALGEKKMVFVRKMQRGDAKQASRMTKEIMLDCWKRYEKNYYPKKALDFDISFHSPKYYRDCLKVETNFAFVAEKNSETVGIADGRLIGESGLARLGWIAVHPTHQNKGTGETLLEQVIEHCRAEDRHKITLCTLPVLIPAVNVYLKYGFVPEAYLHKEWWNVDFIKMSKWL
jgi:GNAT superfamily N-acetyltransferase